MRGRATAAHRIGHMALMICTVHIYAVPASVVGRVSDDWVILEGDGERRAHVGKKVFTRMPPAQYLFGKYAVSLAETPIGFG
jgi:hypothetical protein